MSVRQLLSSHGTATVAQTGTYNSVVLDQDGAFAGGTHIEQVGSMNSANSTVRDDALDSIRQVGTGNSAATDQSGDFNASVIVEKGNNNQATVVQSLGSNDSLIRQIGNHNSAVVLQANLAGSGLQNSASIRQIGNGFVAAITQTGGDNHAGVYQH